ncbi:MAG: peptide ABC transporter substrate-binding protein [Opitutus sp.]
MGLPHHRWLGNIALAAAIGASSVLLMSSCGRRSSHVDKNVREQILLIGNKDEPDTFDPHLSNASSTHGILSTLFEGLVNLANDAETILPGVADRWEISTDTLTYTFHLRANAHWSNGDALTAVDFRDSFLRIIDPKLGSECATYMLCIAGARDFLEGRSLDPATVGVRVIDAQTLAITLAHPAPYCLKLLSQCPFYPVHRASVEAAGGWRIRTGDWTRSGHLISNGAFTLAEWRQNAFTRVVRNEEYWGAAKVRLKELRFFPTDNEASEELSYRSGQLHVTYRIPEHKVAIYERDRPTEIHLAPLLRTDLLTFNVSAAPFTDARLRRAFALAVDRPRLVKAALGKLGISATAMTPPSSSFTPKPVVRFDVAEAKRLLTEAGFPGGAGLPAIQLSLNGNAGSPLLIGELVQQMWLENLGVRVELRPLEFKIYLTLNRTKDFQVTLDGWSSGIPDPRDLLQTATSRDPNNSAGWSNTEFDQAFAAADATGAVAERNRAFDEMEAVIARETPYSPLYHAVQGFLVQTTVHGWRDNPLRLVDWRELWLESPP